MRQLRLILFSLITMVVSNNAIANKSLPSDSSISISITLSRNSSVSLARSQDGLYLGSLTLSVVETSRGKTYKTSKPLSGDTVAILVRKALGLGLLEIKGNEARMIDSFVSNISIKQISEERSISLAIGVPNDKNSERAAEIIGLLSSELNVTNNLHWFLNTLPSGVYSVGMSSVRVHELGAVGGKRSSLYLAHEELFKQGRILIPLYLINGKIVEPVELNNYELKDIETQEVMKEGAQASALYGAAGANGVVLLKTKAKRTKAK
jgi:TonB-dependent SusC/RagA subfamily outer membrane receptor